MFSRELSENEDIYLQKPNLKTEKAGYLIHIESDSPLLVVLTIHIIIAVRRILIKILSAVINDWERINDFINPRSVECRNNSLGNRNRTNVKHRFKFTHAAGHACRNDQCANFHRKSPKRRFSKLYYNFIEL